MKEPRIRKVPRTRILSNKVGFTLKNVLRVAKKEISDRGNVKVVAKNYPLLLGLGLLGYS